MTNKKSGGLFDSLSQLFFLTPELIDIVKFRHSKMYENKFLLTNLYIKKGYSLRRISKELGCSRSLVRKKLIEVGIDNFEHEIKVDTTLRKKIVSLGVRGDSYQTIAEKFNLWRIATRSRDGKWYGKTVRDFIY